MRSCPNTAEAATRKQISPAFPKHHPKSNAEDIPHHPVPNVHRGTVKHGVTETVNGTTRTTHVNSTRPNEPTSIPIIFVLLSDMHSNQL